MKNKRVSQLQTDAQKTRVKTASPLKHTCLSGSIEANHEDADILFPREKP
jgi:hypothetical protein